MISKNLIITFSFTFLSTILILLSFTLSGNAQTLYSCSKLSPELFTINPNTGATLTTTEITLAGFTLRGCNGLARDPTTGVCWIMVNVNPGGDPPLAPRILATIDQDTGVATEVGDTGLPFAGITFDSSGTLYGITGDQRNSMNPIDPEELFILSKTDGSPTPFQTLGNGDDGEAIAFNPLDGLIYHASGNAPPLNNNVQIFETVNPNNNVITPIIIFGETANYNEVASIVHQSGNVFLEGTTIQILYSITGNGVVTELGDMDHVSKGLAFDCGVAPQVAQVPTLSEWGLIAMAGVLGIVGFMVIRRRKVTA